MGVDNQSPRFTVDYDLIAVHDTETDLYAGYIFADSAAKAAHLLNTGRWGAEEMAGGWQERSYYLD